MELPDAKPDPDSSFKDEKYKLFTYIKESLVRLCNELYNLCITEEYSLCQEVTLLLQKVVYDLIILKEWLALRNQTDTVPLPVKSNYESFLHSVKKCTEDTNIFNPDPDVPNKESGEKLFIYIQGNVVRTCDELYHICLNEEDHSLCQDVSVLLQNVAYDFVVLEEWLKLKDHHENINLPVRKNYASLLHANASAPAELQNLVSGGTTNIDGSCPNSYQFSQTSDCTRQGEKLDQSAQTSSHLKSPLESENLTELSTNYNKSDDQASGEPSHVRYFGTYIDPPIEDDGTTQFKLPRVQYFSSSFVEPHHNMNNSWENHYAFSSDNVRQDYEHSFGSNINSPTQSVHSSGLYAFTPPNSFQGNLAFPTQFIPHFHIPYQVITPDIGSNMYPVPHMGQVCRPIVPRHSRRNSKRIKDHVFKPHHQSNRPENGITVIETGGCVLHNNPSSSNIFMSNDISNSNTSETYRYFANDSCRSPSDRLNINQNQNSKTEVAPGEPEVVVHTEKDSNIIKCDHPNFDQNNTSINQTIFGIPDKESLDDFPELNSNFQQKMKPRVNATNIANEVESNKAANLKTNSSSLSEDWKEKKASFSDITKLSNHVINKHHIDRTMELLSNSTCTFTSKGSETSGVLNDNDAPRSSENTKEQPVKVVEDNQLLNSDKVFAHNVETKSNTISPIVSLQDTKTSTTKDTIVDIKKGTSLSGLTINKVKDNRTLNSHEACCDNVEMKSNVHLTKIYYSKKRSFAAMERMNMSSPPKSVTSAHGYHAKNVTGDVPQTENETNSDSDGWEVVRTRSKWRETSDFKPLRNSSKSQRQSNSLSCNYLQNGQNGRENDSNSGDTKNLSYGGLQSNHKSDITCNGGLQSNHKSDVTCNGSNEASPENPQCIENMDATEIYTDYMTYLRNVDLADPEFETDPDEEILHPDSDGVGSTQPASLEQITEFVNKNPKGALDFKKKLADRIRHQEELKKKNEAKHETAYKNRLQFLQDKTAKFRGMVQKVEEVKAAQHELAMQRKTLLDLKLKKAEEKRKMHLNIIKRKAHDEEEKLKEIAFINELEAQNRRHDSLALRQEHEERLQCLVEERQRKLEEKAAKEAAVEERKKALEAERMEKLELMRERRRRKEESIDRKQQEKEQERLEIARERAREREERLQARQTAHLATVEELQKRIQQKQEQSHKRHVERIELIRQKAVEIGLHRNSSDPISNPAQRRSPRLNKAQDKSKIYLKKKLKKIKTRMSARGKRYIETTHNSIEDLVSDDTYIKQLARKLMEYTLNKTYIWTVTECDIIDQYLDEILFCLHEEPKLADELKNMKVFVFIESVLSTFNHTNPEKLNGSALKCIIKVFGIFDLSCMDSSENCLYLLLSNILVTLLDSLKFSLQALEVIVNNSTSWELIVEVLLRLTSVLIDGIERLPDNVLHTIPDFQIIMKDILSYILCSGLVSRLEDLVWPSIAEDKYTCETLFVYAVDFYSRLLNPWFISDELTKQLKSTDLFGMIPLLYEGLGLMTHISNDDDNDEMPEYCVHILKLFYKLAQIDLKSFQEILGGENIALQWRGIASGLMSFCASNDGLSHILNIVIVLVGYFAIHNKQNQTLLQSGRQPTVLQQLVKLPFKYFCDPMNMEFLFPTLIACSYNNATNRAIVESELDYSTLEKFIKSDIGRNNRMIKLVLELEDPSKQND